MFERIKSFLSRTPAKGVTWKNNIRPGTGWGLPFCTLSQTGTYDNAFASISRIAESFAEVLPYAVDANGRRLAKQPNLIRVLYNPNREMSGTDFMETLITLLLVHPIVYIMLWRQEGGRIVRGGPVTPDTIAGLTFLQGASVLRTEGETRYVYNGQTYTTRDVIALSLSVNPYSLLSGYSPSEAIKKWATVDDYIAEYQAATFRNDAKPAGEMIITAPTVEAYNEAVDHIQAAHRGPNNANNTIYTHRPTSQVDGKPMAAGVEWVPFAQSNKDLTLDSLFNQANKKLDMAFGVPEEVKGYLQNSNYASAEVAQYVFQRYVIYPKLVKVYSKLTHEFNRATGGLGFALDFDYELPVLTDTRKVQADSLKVLLDAGFSVDSAVDALQLPASFKKLNREAVEETPNPEADVDNEERPAQAETAKSAACARQKAAWGQEPASPILLMALSNYLRYFFNKLAVSLPEDDTGGLALVQAQHIAETVSTDGTADKLRTLVIAALYLQLAMQEESAARGFAKLVGVENIPTTLTPTELEALSQELQSQTTNLHGKLNIGEVDIRRDIQTEVVENYSDKISAALSEHHLTQVIPDIDSKKTYPAQLAALLIAFATQRLDAVEGTIARASTTAEARVAIQAAANEGNYYVERWANSEAHRAEELGTLLAAENAGEAAQLEPVKIWHINPASPDICEDCIAMNGQTVRADQPFSNGDMVPHYHPHCYCTMSVDFRALKPASGKAVKVKCPSCGRYMFESAGGTVKNVICANSKCKKHYDFEISDEIKATEVKKTEEK